MDIKRNLAHPSNFGGTRPLADIRYIVIHYTGNDGDSDENNGIYFGREPVGVSAHYFVDSDSVTQSVPDESVAYHCGAKTYVHPQCRNGNSIGVELCDDRKDGRIYPSEETIANALALVRQLMTKYGIPKENVVRHYDVSGKRCPGYWCGSKEKDGLWQHSFWDRLPRVEAAPVFPLPTLGKGDRGGAVRAMQAILLAWGYDCGGFGADGIFGKGTEDSVRAFQLAQGLIRDGICGVNTWCRLLGVEKA